MKKTIIGSGILGTTMGLAMAGSLLTAPAASAHGYVGGGDLLSRSAACKAGLNSDCGGAEYEPQSLEGPKGFVVGGPADGQLASGGGNFGGKLDAQSPERWYQNEITPGPTQIGWTFTAPHRTSGWHYYMTPQGWDQNAPLNRGDLEFIGKVEHDGSAASSNPTHTINVPGDRNGYHVILAVWDIADTTNAFYNAIDVNVAGSAPEIEAPGAPTTLAVSAVTDSTATLNWQSTTAGSAAVDYQVYRDGELVGTTSGTSFEDLSLSPDTGYSYTVTARNSAGASPVSQPLTVTTGDVRDDEVFPPQQLHSMGETTGSVDLMWFAPTNADNVTGYQIYRDGELVGTTPDKMLTDGELAPGTEYRYEVRAIDSAGNQSPVSNELVVKTRSEATNEHPLWDAKASYQKGELVTYDGKTYKAAQSYSGVGDPNWINALSLWNIVSNEPSESKDEAISDEPKDEAISDEPKDEAISDEPKDEAIDYSQWDAKASYQKGDLVTYDGKTYKAVQSYSGFGDPNWINALSLWNIVS
ncbi:MAG: chitin-binding protein [Actinomycetes bacterium]|jgi:chitin-binding protein